MSKRSRSDLKVAKALERLEWTLGRMDQEITLVSTLMESIMADKQQVSDEINKLKQAIEADQASDQAVVDQLNSANAALQKTIDDLKAGGNQQEASDLEDILSQLKDVSTSIKPVSTGAAAGPTTPGGETEVPVQP